MLPGSVTDFQLCLRLTVSLHLHCASIRICPHLYAQKKHTLHMLKHEVPAKLLGPHLELECSTTLCCFLLFLPFLGTWVFELLLVRTCNVKLETRMLCVYMSTAVTPNQILQAYSK